MPSTTTTKKSILFILQLLGLPAPSDHLKEEASRQEQPRSWWSWFPIIAAVSKNWLMTCLHYTNVTTNWQGNRCVSHRTRHTRYSYTDNAPIPLLSVIGVAFVDFPMTFELCIRCEAPLCACRRHVDNLALSSHLVSAFSIQRIWKEDGWWNWRVKFSIQNRSIGDMPRRIAVSHSTLTNAFHCNRYYCLSVRCDSTNP